jgi:small subunit ribosomal protein S20
MPIIKSAKKRVRVARKATIRNAKTKRSLKTAINAFQKSLTGDKKKTAELQYKAQSELGKAGKKHVMHKNKVARKQSQLAAAAKKAGVGAQPTVKKVAPKKTAATAKKKPVAKKPVAKKPATKK